MSGEQPRVRPGSSPQLSLAIVLPDLGGGGAQRVMLTLAGGLDRIRFAPRLMVLGGSQAFAADVAPGLPVEIGQASRVRDGLPWLVRRLHALRPHVVISVMGYLNLALLAARPFLPRNTGIVVREANILTTTEHSLPRWMPARSLYRHLYPKAAAIVSPSTRIAGEISQAAPTASARIAVIPNPVDVDHLRGRAGQPLREPGEGLRLVAAGRLTRQKGFDRLLDVIAKLAPSARLSVFGAGPDEASLRASIATRGLADRIRLAGFSPDLPAWIAGADAFLLPSRWEGLPNVVLESLALGTPVIASREAAVEDVAVAAPAGAVRIGLPETQFLSAISGVDPAIPPVARLRRSLLPDAYTSGAVIAAWQALLARVATDATEGLA